VADLSKRIARDYGVLVEDGPDAGVALRGLFVISDKGVLRQITVNDLPVGRSVDEALRLVEAFQFVDKHGEVWCVLCSVCVLRCVLGQGGGRALEVGAPLFTRSCSNNNLRLNTRH